jgi:hypothetical protein
MQAELKSSKKFSRKRTKSAMHKKIAYDVKILQYVDWMIGVRKAK